MTATNESLGLDKTREEFKETFLKSLNNPDVSVEHLRDLLDQARQYIPDLLSKFQQNGYDSLSDNTRRDWNTDYFDHHINYASLNFSYERITHLIDVRNHLRDLGVKSFVPAPRSPSGSQTESPYNMTSNYTPSDNLQRFVASGDLLAKRTALRMELHRNGLTSDDLRAALAWTKANAPGLFETYSEKAFARGMEDDREIWDSQYYANQVVYLKTNFSEERFLHLIEVRGLLRQQGVEGFAARPTQPKDSTSSTSSSSASAKPRNGQSRTDTTSTSQPEHHPVLKTALIAGGAVAALAILLITLMNGQN